MRRRTPVIVTVVALGLLNLALAPGAGSAERDRAGSGDGVGVAEDVGVAIEHVRADPGRYGVGSEDVADLAVSSAYRSAHNGVTHVYLQQQIGGLEVAGSSTTVNVRDGSVLHVGARLVADLAGASGTAVLGPVAAADAAARHLDLAPSTPIVALELGRDGSRESLVSDGGIARQPIPAELVYQALDDGRIRLAWRVEIEEVARAHWWNVTVDAETGEVLVLIDYTDHDEVEHVAAATARSEPRAGAADHAAAWPKRASGGAVDGSSYRVFAYPLESPNDGDRELVEEPADPDASPFGWHDTDGEPGPEHTVTRGNNASAYLDSFNAGTPIPFVTEAEGGDDLTFDFAFDPDHPPTVNKDAAVTNLFYWNNITHDVFYRYGFDEAAGNFQVNNYGRGGIGGDDVRAEAQDGSGVNNANFSTPPDGSRPRMQMYVWTSALHSDQRIIDGDFDAGVIIHEYGHGISHRLTGGPDSTSCLSHQERPSEGWSDWLAIAALALPDESGEQPRGMGTYVLNQSGRAARGIRPTPYSTDMSINGATYDSIKTLAVPHGVGYVWSTMLWEVFWDLVDEHGFNPDVYDDWSTGGNNLAIQLVMDGMKLQPCSPGFVDARDAILAADVALTDGQNQCTIWRGFAKRGLGFSADQGEPTSRGDGTEAFDLPPECA